MALLFKRSETDVARTTCAIEALGDRQPRTGFLARGEALMVLDNAADIHNAVITLFGSRHYRQFAPRIAVLCEPPFECRTPYAWAAGASDERRCGTLVTLCGMRYTLDSALVELI